MRHQRNLYTTEKLGYIIGYNSGADNMGPIFIRLAAVSSQIYKITRNSERIPTYSRSRSPKVIRLSVRPFVTRVILVSI